MIPCRLFMPMLLVCLLPALVNAQTYRGQRMCIFNVQILKKSGRVKTIRCSVANTGRLPIELNIKQIDPSSDLLVEFDTLNLPDIFRNKTGLLENALRQQRLRIAPGEIRTGLWMRIRTRSGEKSTKTASPVTTRVCADLTLDTARIVAQSEKSWLVRATVRNIGNAPVRLNAPETDDFRLYVFFISGEKLTRGAIPAANASLASILLKNASTVLPAGDTVDVEIEISLKNRTRFSPNFALQLISPSGIIECDQMNNTLIFKE